MKRLIVSLLLLLSVRLSAATYYVTQAGAGSGNGSSLGNAASVATLNSHTSAGDDIISLNGTITTGVVVHDSGTSGHPITYRLESGCAFSTTVWSTSGAINLSAKDYITIDGQSVGIIENTANGTNLANQLSSYGIKATGCKSLTIQNLTIRNIYVRVKGTDTSSGAGNNAAIQHLDASGRGITNFTVTNCTLSDAYIGIDSDYGPGGSGYTFSYNTSYNCNWNGRAGDRGATSTLAGLSVHHNTFYNWSNWSDTSGNSYHHNGFYAWAESGGTLTDATFYDNTIGPGFDGSYQTSGIFTSGTNGTVSAVTIYNNVFVCAAGESASNGMIASGSSLGTGTYRIYNNTFIGGGTGQAIDLSGNAVAQTIVVENNLGSGGAGGTFIALYTNGNVTFTCNYNLGYSYDANNAYIYSANSSGVFKTFAQWKALGFDTSPGVNTDPLLTNTYRLGAGSPAIGTGTDLSAYFTTDAAGYTRTVPWDIGAYKWLGGGSAFSGTLTLAGNASLK